MTIDWNDPMRLDRLNARVERLAQVTSALRKAWDEEKHPRDDSGRWARVAARVGAAVGGLAVGLTPVLAYDTGFRRGRTKGWREGQKEGYEWHERYARWLKSVEAERAKTATTAHAKTYGGGTSRRLSQQSVNEAVQRAIERSQRERARQQLLGPQLRGPR